MTHIFKAVSNDGIGKRLKIQKIYEQMDAIIMQKKEKHQYNLLIVIHDRSNIFKSLMQR